MAGFPSCCKFRYLYALLALFLSVYFFSSRTSLVAFTHLSTMASQSPNCFFGLEIQPDKKYTQTPPDGVHLHLSQAALPPENNGRVSVKVTIDGKTFCLCTLVAGTIDQSPLDLKWSRDTTFLGSAMSMTVHRCLVCCVDGSEGRWKEVHGVWWGEAASAKPMGGKTI